MKQQIELTRRENVFLSVFQTSTHRAIKKVLNAIKTQEKSTPAHRVEESDLIKEVFEARSNYKIQILAFFEKELSFLEKIYGRDEMKIVRQFIADAQEIEMDFFSPLEDKKKRMDILKSKIAIKISKNPQIKNIMMTLIENCFSNWKVEKNFADEVVAFSSLNQRISDILSEIHNHIQTQGGNK